MNEFPSARGAPRRRTAATAVAAAVLLLGLLIAGALGARAESGARTVGPAAPDGAPNQAVTEITIVDNAFQPEVVTITVGSVVRWTNRGQRVHTSTQVNGLWDWVLVPGASFAARFWAPGVYRYYCRYHPEMTGRVVVTGNAPPMTPTFAPPPPPPGTPEPGPGPGPGPWPAPTSAPMTDAIVYDYFPDGQTSGRTDLFAVRPDGSGKQQLTNTSTLSEAQPSWSPDRRRVAYTVTAGDSATGQWALAVLDLGIGQARAISFGGYHYEPDWRPDGAQLVFTSLQSAGAGAGSSELAVINPDGTGYRPMLRMNSSYYTVGNPAWSPDQRRIAFTVESSIAGAEIYVFDLQNGTIRELYDHDAFDDIDPAWSPDGRFVAFASGPTQYRLAPNVRPRHDIWVLDTATGVAGAVAAVTDWDLRGPAWSPDGRSLVFSAQYSFAPATPQWGLYMVPATGGEVTPLVAGVEPDWGSQALQPLPTPPPNVTATVPPVPTFPVPPTLPPPPTWPAGPSPTPPLPPTFPPPPTLEPTVEVTPTSIPPTQTVPTATVQPPPVVRGSIFLPIVYDTVGPG